MAASILPSASPAGWVKAATTDPLPTDLYDHQDRPQRTLTSTGMLNECCSRLHLLRALNPRTGYDDTMTQADGASDRSENIGGGPPGEAASPPCVRAGTRSYFRCALGARRPTSFSPRSPPEFPARFTGVFTLGRMSDVQGPPWSCRAGLDMDPALNAEKADV